MHGRETEWALRNARLILADRVVTGSMLLRGDRIAAVDAGPSRVGEDMDGDYLMPGMVDVHTDSLERQFTPRPGVYWPSPLAAAQANDAMLAGCGVTTVLDAVCAEAFPREETRRRLFADAIAAVTEGERRRFFLAEHRLHVRCETADPAVLQLFEPHAPNPLLALVSLMDHTPGQRQYRDMGDFRRYYSAEGWTDAEFEDVVARCVSNQERYAAAHRQTILDLCRARAVVMASHDDSCVDHVVQAKREGIRICEFPTTLEAAGEARERGMDVVMGAPNVVLGRSHSGNVSVREVAATGHLDILSSDYAPASMLDAAFTLHREIGMEIPKAVALVTANPARALGMDDRGRLEPGRRADMVRFRGCRNGRSSTEPCILGVWVRGRKVLGQ